jgi:hypothetical protein
MLIVLFNGPPGSGKDTIANGLVLGMQPGLRRRYMFAEILKERTCAFFQTEHSWEFYEDSKDIQMEEFEGMSPREAYIWMSEKVIKPQFGIEWFGHQLVKKLETSGPAPIVYVSDHGFTSEGFPLAERYGTQNMCIVKIKREGKSFANDSREWVQPLLYRNVLGKVPPRVIYINNDHDIQSAIDACKEALFECMNPKSFGTR